MNAAFLPTLSNMDRDPELDRLRAMIRSYQGAHHTVVAFSQNNGETRFVVSGEKVPATESANLICEIGSITKVFTAILLCVLVEEGKVDPCAPLSDMADELVVVPPWITPERLISHTSGLPNIQMPIWRAMLRSFPEGPYAAFSRSDLLEWFHNWKGKAPGPKLNHAYSNLGVGLLGEAMAIKEAKAFVHLLADKVIRPLGLNDTVVTFDQDQQSRFVQPRITSGRAVPPWTFQALAAAGCLRSSARDLAQFANRVCQAVSDPKDALDRAILRSTMPIFDLSRHRGAITSAQCSGWLSSDDGETRVLHASGGTAGSTSALYICPGTATACGIFSNNGVAANLFAATKLHWSNQPAQAKRLFETVNLDL